MIKPKANPRTKAKIKIVSKRRKGGGVYAKVHPLPQPPETSSARTSRQTVSDFNSPQQSNSKSSILKGFLKFGKNKVDIEPDIEPKQSGGMYGFKRISRKVAPSDLSPPRRKTPPQTQRTPSQPQPRTRTPSPPRRRTPSQPQPQPRTPSPPRRRTPSQPRTPSPPRRQTPPQTQLKHKLNMLAEIFSNRNQVVPSGPRFGPKGTGKGHK